MLSYRTLSDYVKHRSSYRNTSYTIRVITLKVYLQRHVKTFYYHRAYTPQHYPIGTSYFGRVHNKNINTIIKPIKFSTCQCSRKQYNKPSNLSSPNNHATHTTLQRRFTVPLFMQMQLGVVNITQLFLIQSFCCAAHSVCTNTCLQLMCNSPETPNLYPQINSKPVVM